MVSYGRLPAIRDAASKVSNAQIAAIPDGVGRVKSTQNRRSEIGSEMRRLSRVAPESGHGPARVLRHKPAAGSQIVQLLRSATSSQARGN
jgi:hypothetical protein